MSIRNLLSTDSRIQITGFKMKVLIKSFLLLVIIINPLTSYSQEIPQVHISNGIIDCDIYLPDVEKGYYRGPRFDWGGVMSNMEYKNHSYFGKWYEKYDSTNLDHIMGPVEAFDPIGHKEARPGDEFVKIGIGILQKPDTTSYHFHKPYKIIDNGVWKVKTKKDEVRFIHQIFEGKYPYSYRKVIKLKGNKLIIEHKLDNKGNHTIDTNVFNHNFFVIDSQTTGPGFKIKFPFKIEIDGKLHRPDLAKIVNGNEIKFVKEFEEKDIFFISKLSGFENSKDDYDIRVENSETGAGVRITCDRPLSNVVFWSSMKTFSPEPYIDIKLKSSESFSWTITYEFYTLK